MGDGFNFLLRLSQICGKELKKKNEKVFLRKFAEQSAVRKSQFQCGNEREQDLHRRPPEPKPSEIQIIREPTHEISKQSKEVESQKTTEVTHEINLSRPQYYCEKCGFGFEKVNSYEKHLLTDQHLDLVHCLYCHDRVKKIHMDVHMRMEHRTNVENLRILENGCYQCTKCSVSFKHVSKYILHCATLTHRGLKRCNQCNFVSSPEELQIHEREIHAKVGALFQCKICQKKFTTPAVLFRHISSVHSTEKPFKCSQCDRTFTRMDLRKKHEATHTVNRLYSCAFCSLAFKIKSNLLQHMKIHFKSRYQCQKCYRSFTCEEDRNLHLQIHDGIKFSCMVCGLEFPTPGKRERHYKVHMKGFKTTSKPMVRRAKVSQPTQENSAPMPQNSDLIYLGENIVDKATSRVVPLPENVCVKESNLICESSDKSELSLPDDNCQKTLPKHTSRKSSPLYEKNEYIINKEVQINLINGSDPDKNKKSSLCDQVVKAEPKGNLNKTKKSKRKRHVTRPKESCPVKKVKTESVKNEIENSSKQVEKIVKEENHSTKNGSLCESVEFDVINENFFVSENHFDLVFDENVCPRPSLIISEPNQSDSQCVIQADSVFPEQTSFINVDDLPVMDTNVPILYVDNDQCQELQYIMQDTDSGVSLLNADDISQDQLNLFNSKEGYLEGISGNPVQKPNKRKSMKKPRARKCAKSMRSREVPGKKVIVINQDCDDDTFTLPEFILEEEGSD